MSWEGVAHSCGWSEAAGGWRERVVEGVEGDAVRSDGEEEDDDDDEEEGDDEGVCRCVVGVVSVGSARLTASLSGDTPALLC